MSTILKDATLARLLGAATPPAARFDPPAADEHDPYYGTYVRRVPPGDFVAGLRSQVDELVERFGALTPAQADFAYAPGKWTVKEMLGHMIDTERVFLYRATCFARQDPGPLPGYDQDAWIPPAAFGARRMSDLVAEWLAVRAATLALVEGLPADAPLRRGVASGREFTVRALLYIILGHVHTHFDVFAERYQGAADWPA